MEGKKEERRKKENPATDRNKYRDPQPDTTQRVRDLGTLSPK